MTNSDSLGDRMKRYEKTYQHRMVDRMYTIIRLDGRSFHTYTRKLSKPFDKGLIDDMIETTVYLCENVQNCKAGYVQSDEITLILSDFDQLNTTGWFDNELQKMCSIAASDCTAKFNHLRMIRHLRGVAKDLVIEAKTITEDTNIKLANFDSRVFQVPTLSETYNNLIWRQRDAIRNSVASSAQSVYSAKELHQKNGRVMQLMIDQRSDKFAEKMKACGYYLYDEGWRGLPNHLKNGSFIYKTMELKEFPKESYEKHMAKENNPGKWVVKAEQMMHESLPKTYTKYYKPVSKLALNSDLILSGENISLNPLNLPQNY